MSGFPGSPKLLKGGLVSVDIFNPLASVVVFQYNPEKMSRKLTPRSKSGDGDRGEAQRLEGPPKETITIALEIDATNALAGAAPPAVALGIAPALAALEMMIYPKSALVIANTVLSAFGTIEIIPANAPLTLFVWGPTRVLPVRISDFTITEEAFDTQLNPTLAKVDLSMEVLSYNDLTVTSTGGALFLAHQIAKEVLATAESISNLASLGV